MNPVLSFAESLSKEIKWYGSNENSRKEFLIAGKLSMVYEEGFLRNISAGDTEIIRMIYAAARNERWLTIIPLRENEKIIRSPDSFKITYTCLYSSENISFHAHYTIEGRSDSTIIFTMEGEALQNTKKNRIGICVLHPIEGCSGSKCMITHSNGEMEKGEFPLYVSPHQPFIDISKMEWTTGAMNCCLDFSGDIFETEDQRNWTDSSYKTYSTPLSRPFPVTLVKGEKVNQQIKLKISGEPGEKSINGEKIILAADQTTTYNMPSIGIGRSTRGEPLTAYETGILGKLHFDHYRTDLYLFDEDWKEKATLASKEASGLKYKLVLVLFFDEKAEQQVEDFIDWFSADQPDAVVITIFHKMQKATPDQLTAQIAPGIKNVLPGVKICCGTNANFAQLNRNRPASQLNDLVCYSIHPQEHASDNTTIVENLKGQQYTVESARHCFSGKGIFISPVNLRRRFNPNIEYYETGADNREMPSQVDKRIMSLFGAGWITASIKYLSESEAYGLTYLETAGERGIFQGEFPSRWPDKFNSVEGMIFPVYHVFNFILRYKHLKVVRSRSSWPEKVEILSFSDGSMIKHILVNFTEEAQNVVLPNRTLNCRMKQLNAGTFASAASDPGWLDNTGGLSLNADEICLEPFSVSFIE